MLRNTWQAPSPSPQPLRKKMQLPVLCWIRGSYAALRTFENPCPGHFGKKWAALFPFRESSILLLTSSAGAWIYISVFCTSESMLQFVNLSDHCLNPCILLTSIRLCSREPHKLWGTSNNNFVCYKPHFWSWRLTSMVLCETADKLILLSPIYCWPLQLAESCTFWCVFFLPWPFWPCNISDRLPFGHGGQELHAVFKIRGTLSLPSGVTMVSVPYVPDVASALLSMGATWACQATLSSDCTVMVVLHKHKCLRVKWRTLLPPAAFFPPLGFVSLWGLDCPITWSEWKEFPWFQQDWKSWEHLLFMSRGAAWRSWAMVSAEWGALLVLGNGKFHAHGETRLIEVEEEWSAVPVAALRESFTFLNAFCERREFSLSVWCCFPLYQHFSQNGCKHLKSGIN